MINGLSTLLWRNCPQPCTPVLHSLFSRSAVFGRPGAGLTFLPQPRGLCLNRLGSPRQNEISKGGRQIPVFSFSRHGAPRRRRSFHLRFGIGWTAGTSTPPP